MDAKRLKNYPPPPPPPHRRHRHRHRHRHRKASCLSRKKDVLALMHPKPSPCAIKTINHEMNSDGDVPVDNSDDIDEDAGGEDVASQDAVLVAFRAELTRTAGCEALLKHIKRG